MKDKEILRLYWARDEAAITATADAYQNYCFSIAYNILNNQEDAEECVNDTWLNAWRSIPPHRPERLSAYLGKITRNLALNRYKRLHTQKRGQGQVELALAELEDCIPAQTGIEQIADEMALSSAMEAFLRTQTRTERSIFVGRYWYLYSIQQLAEAYQMSESKTVSLLYRMRNRLKRYLEKEEIFL